MYFQNLGGLKKDIKKALKSGDAAKLQKALAAEQKKLDKNPTSKKAAKRADYVSQLTSRLQQVTSPVPAPTVPAIATAPLPVSAPPSTVSPMPAVAPPAFSIAPPGASDSFAQPLTQAPTLFDAAPSATPDSTAPASAEGSSNLPLILGAAGLAALFFFGRKKRG